MDLHEMSPGLTRRQWLAGTVVLGAASAAVPASHWRRVSPGFASSQSIGTFPPFRSAFERAA